MTHALHRMTAEYRCIDCNRTEADLLSTGASVSGFDALYAPMPMYATAILAESPIYGHTFTTSDGIDLEWTTDMSTFESGYAQTN